MYGGLLKSASALAIVAAAGLYGVSSASAADLGGDCCADLEERVAELEATTVRKGTRKVSVTISGQISQQLMFWDDGVQKDMYISGPAQSNSRWRITGSAKISPSISAGFIYEFEAFRSGSTSQTQANGPGPGNTVGSTNPPSRDVGDDGGATSANLREAMAWIEHERLGRVSLGAGSSAANNVILVDLSGKGMGASNDVRLMNSGFRIRNNAGNFVGTRSWANFFQGGQDWLNERNQHIQYRTPTIAGFTLGASFGEDNYWDAALRYAGEFNGIRIAAAVGYSVRSEYNQTVVYTLNQNTGVVGASGGSGGFGCTINCDKEVKQLAGSLSIRHMPTGLFFTGAAGQRDNNNFDTINAAGAVTSTRSFDSNFYYLSGGVARNFFGIGDTVLFGEYSQWKGMGQEFVATGGDTKVEHWGVGIVQHVDAAAMEFWLTYKNYSLTGADFCGAGSCRDFDYVLAGTRIRF